MNDRIDIYSFSGTGNTDLMVTRLSEILRGSGKKVIVLPLEKGFKETNENADMIGFAFPASCQAVSPPVWKFFKELPKNKGTKVFVIITMNDSTYILKPLYRLLKRKGFVPEACVEISMPNNMLTEPIKENDDRQRISQGYDRITEFANKLMSGGAEWKEEKKGSGFIGFLSRCTRLPFYFMRMAFMMESDQGKCAKCGLCVKQCPVGNISLAEYPVHGSKCALCMRCVAFCPQKAIEIKGKQKVEIRNANEIK